MSKKELGQFYTKNYEYILQNLSIPDDENITQIIEPFAGEGDLLEFIKENNKRNVNVLAYDIQPKKWEIHQRDTLSFPPKYDSHTFVITNPPYLARNKNKDKMIYDIFGYNDLYKCFLSIIIKRNIYGGILIIPLNFFCSQRKNDEKLRDKFLSKYDIKQLNIFEENVFDDTTTTVCSFLFEKFDKTGRNETTESKEKNESQNINVCVYPDSLELSFTIYKKYGWLISGEIYSIPINKNIKIKRITEDSNFDEKDIYFNIDCLDSGLEEGKKIRAYLSRKPYIGKNTSRTKATLIFERDDKEIIFSDKQLQKLKNEFNDFINEKRDEYHSLFLTNYRESKDYARKRITFTLVYNILNNLINKLNF